MKILALNPPFLKGFTRQSRSPSVAQGGTFYYPYYLAYAVGMLEKSGFETLLIDAVAKKWDVKKVIEFSNEIKPDLTIIFTSTPSINNDVWIASEIKKAVSDSYISLVGNHPSRLPNETLGMSKYIDSICRGEFDNTVVELADAIKNQNDFENILGLTYRKNDLIFHNPDRGLIENLDALPFVSKVYNEQKFFDINDYFYAQNLYPMITILTARGCPWNCSFCDIPFKNSYRARSVSNVIDELKYIQSELPEVREVMIEDDTFPVNKNRTILFSEELIKNKIDLKWSCNVRVDADPFILSKMKEAGCRLLCVGFETPDQNILDSVNKNTSKDQQINFMNTTKELGLLVNGCFMIGLHNDDKQSIERTIEFAKMLNPDTAQFLPLMAYPGTEAFNYAKERGILIDDFNSLLDERGYHMTNIQTDNFTPLEIKELRDKAYRDYYFRLDYISYKFKHSLMNPSEFSRMIKGSFNFLKYLIT